MLELCGKEPSDVNKGLSLWRSREGSRLSLMVTIWRSPSYISTSHSDSANASLVGEIGAVRSRPVTESDR